MGKKQNLNLNLTAYAKINSKLVTDLHKKHETFRQKYRRKSLETQARQSLLEPDTKSTIYNRKN